jgi:hypothetical protein
VFFEIVSSSLLREDTGFLLEVLAGGDTRRGLSLVREFLASGHTSADHALASFLLDGEYHFPLHELFRGAVLGQRKHYREEESLIPNIFDSKLDAGDLELLRLSTVNWFVSQMHHGMFEGTHTETIVADLLRAGVSESDGLRMLEQLCDFRVLRTVDGLPFSGESRLQPTRFAAYLLNELASSFMYIDLCLVDAAIYDDGTWDELVSLTRHIEAVRRYDRVEHRIDRVRRFIEYAVGIEEKWAVNCRRIGLDTRWSELFVKERLMPKLETDLERVGRSAQKQVTRRPGGKR